MDHPPRSPVTSPPYHKLQVSDDVRRRFPIIARPSSKHEQGSLASIQTQAGILAVRDAIPADIGPYVNYWHYSGEEIKNLLGIDRNKLGIPEDSRTRFLEMIRVPGMDQANVVFTITLNVEVIGYTNINRYGPDDNYVHLHTYRSYVRSALKARRMDDNTRLGASPAAILIGLIGMYFNLFPLRRVVFQTRTNNRWINHALDLYMPPAETKYFNIPAGLAAPGEYHLRYVHREDVPWMLARAELLRNAKEARTGVDGLYPSQPEAAEGSRLPLGPTAAKTVLAEASLAAR